MRDNQERSLTYNATALYMLQFLFGNIARVYLTHTLERKHSHKQRVTERHRERNTHVFSV